MTHAIPQWLRDQFDVIELRVRKMGAEAVFTQMRTKVQAYFEMQRSVENSRAGRDLAIITQQKNLIESLREDLQLAIAIDCQDDVIDACAEAGIKDMTPGKAIRHLNDLKVDLLNSLEECLPCLGWKNMSDEYIKREHELGNGYAELILRARFAIAKAKG